MAISIQQCVPLLQYYHGLWRDLSTAWNTVWSGTLRMIIILVRPAVPRAPSWSWAALDGPIEFTMFAWRHHNITELDLSIEHIEDMPWDGLAQCYILLVCGVLKSCSRKPKINETPDLNRGTHGFPCAEGRTYFIVNAQQVSVGWVIVDCKDAEPEVFFCTPTYRERPTDRFRYILALESCEEKSQGLATYRRIGAGCVYDLISSTDTAGTGLQ